MARFIPCWREWGRTCTHGASKGGIVVSIVEKGRRDVAVD